METGVIVSLAAYFVAMLAIGLWAWKRSTDDIDGYLIGGRRLSPPVAALSAGASDMSGWLLLGLPGAAYVAGLSAGWIAIGLFVGAFANYLIVAPRLRVHTERTAIPSPFPNISKSASTTAAMRCASSPRSSSSSSSRFILRAEWWPAASCSKARSGQTMRWACG